MHHRAVECAARPIHEPSCEFAYVVLSRRALPLQMALSIRPHERMRLPALHRGDPFAHYVVNAPAVGAEKRSAYEYADVAIALLVPKVALERLVWVARALCHEKIVEERDGIVPLDRIRRKSESPQLREHCRTHLIRKRGSMFAAASWHGAQFEPLLPCRISGVCLGLTLHVRSPLRKMPWQWFAQCSWPPPPTPASPARSERRRPPARLLSSPCGHCLRPSLLRG